MNKLHLLTVYNSAALSVSFSKLADSWEYLWIYRKTEDMEVHHLESLCVQMCVYVLHESDDAQGNEIPI